MPKSVEVELPDGSIAEFPDDLPEDKFSEAIRGHLNPTDKEGYTQKQRQAQAMAEKRYPRSQMMTGEGEMIPAPQNQPGIIPATLKNIVTSAAVTDPASSSFEEAINKPIPQLLPKGVHDTLRGLATENAVYGLPEGAVKQAARGVVQGAGDVAEGMTSPLGIATLAQSALKAPAVMYRLISAAFALQSGKEAATDMQPLADAVQKKDWETATRLAIGKLGGAAVAVAAGTHALAPEARPVPAKVGGTETTAGTAATKTAQDMYFDQLAERANKLGLTETAKAVKEVPKNLEAGTEGTEEKTKGGDSNAGSIEKAAAVHGDVRAQPRQGEGEVSAEEGGAGVQPPAKQGQAAPEVALKPSGGAPLNPGGSLESLSPELQALHKKVAGPAGFAAQNTGWTFEGVDPQGMTTATSETLVPGLRFTDRRPGSPTEGTTTYLPVDAKFADIVKHLNDKAAEVTAAKPKEVIPSGKENEEKEEVQGVLKTAGGEAGTEGKEESPPAIVDQPVKKTGGKGLTQWAYHPSGQHDLLDTIHDLGGVASASQQKFKGGGEYDAYNQAFGTGMAMRLRRKQGGRSPDKLLDDLRSKGIHFENVDKMYDAVERAAKARQGLTGQRSAEAREIMRGIEQNKDFQETVVQGKGVNVPTKYAGDVLKTGAKFKVAGQEFTVTGYDREADIYELEDGTRWGRQHLHADETFHPDPGTLEKAKGTEETVATQAVPKLGAGEKKTGDLFKGEDQPFNLAGERGTDVERVQAEKEKAAREKREGEALAKKQQQELIGMGAAKYGELDPKESVTGIRNSQVDKERAARGLPPVVEPAKRSFGTVWDQAMERIDNDPKAQDDLIDELREHPRPISDVEDAMLLQRQVDLQNEFEKASREIAQAHEDGRSEDVAELNQRLARWSDQLLDLYNIGKQAGTETARGLNARRLMAKEDFTLAKMTLEKRAANKGKPLTPEQQAEVDKLNKKIEETQKAYDDYVAKTNARIAELESQKGVGEVVKEAEEEGKRSAGKRGARTPDQQQEAAVRSLKRKVEAKAGRDTMTSDIQKIAKAFVRKGIRERVPLVDAVHGVVKAIMPEMTWRETMDAISGYGDFKQLSKDEVAVQLRDLKGQMQQASKLLDMFEAEPPSKTGFERRTPSDTERRMIQQVNEAKKRFGIKTTDPATQLKTALSSLKTRLRNQISDLEDQIASKEKFVNEKAPVPEDAESKALKQKRDALKAEFDNIFGKPEMSDEQRVKNALASLERQSTEIERQIKEGDIFHVDRPSKTPVTAEIEAARAKRDALKLEREYLRDSIQPKERLSQEQIALKALKTRLANRTAELQEKLAKGDFSTKERKPVTLDAQATRLKAENERAKIAFQKGLALDRLKHRTTYEKVSDALVKWRRGFLLSGPITLAKLTAAAVQRLTTTPIEEAAGAGISKLFPQVAAKAARQGGLNTKAEARSITQGFMLGMKDAWKVLRTGKSDLDVLYGKENLLPQTAIDFIGNIHGALKTVPKRAEFERSFEKRVQAAIASGVDATDPLIQSKIAIEAYKDANRSIFMQDNRVVSAYKRALTAFEEKTKKNGAPSAGARAIGTAARLLLPIVKIPTNLVAEVMENATGLISGSAKLANAYRHGIEKLSPEQADLIMRHLKKGSVGGAVMLLGYFMPNAVGGYYQAGQRRDPKDVKAGNIRVGGVNVPAYLLHNPLMEALQIGATVRRVADAKLRPTGETKGVGAGMAAGGLGMLQGVPFVREMLEITKAFNPKERGAFFGELGKSMAVPQLMQEIANQTDKDKTGDTMRRKPETVWQHIETGVPGLRQNVPANPHTAFGDTMTDVNLWKEKKGYTEPGEFVYDADKDPYASLSRQLTYGSVGDARKALDKLTEGKTPAEARKIAQHYRRSLAEHPYLTGSRAHEQEYVKGLSADEKQRYDEARAERKAMWQKFVKAWRSKYPASQ